MQRFYEPENFDPELHTPQPVGERDELLSPPVGRYRHAGTGVMGTPAMYSPYYAARRHTLDNPMLDGLPDRKRQVQILVTGFNGELVWINMRPQDVFPNGVKVTTPINPIPLEA